MERANKNMVLWNSGNWSLFLLEKQTYHYTLRSRSWWEIRSRLVWRSEIPSRCWPSWVPHHAWGAYRAYIWNRKSTCSSRLLIPAIRLNTQYGPWSNPQLFYGWDHLRKPRSHWVDSLLESIHCCYFRILSRLLPLWNVCGWWCSFSLMDVRELELVRCS